MEKRIKQMFIYVLTILIVFRNTVLEYNTFFSNILPVFCLFSSIVFIYYARKIDYKKYIKENYLVVCYTAIRFFSVLVLPDKIQNAKTLFYELYFIIIVQYLYIKDERSLNKMSLILVVSNFCINFVTIILGIFGKSNFLTTIYTSTNAMGSLTCLCLLLFIVFGHKKVNKLTSVGYVIFSLIAIIISESRTPIIMIAFYIFARVIIKYQILSSIDFKKYFMCALNTFLIIAILFSYATKFMDRATNLELMINEYTTNRYYLWKYSIMSLERSPAFGIGDSNIGKERFKEVPEKRFDGLYLSRYRRLSMNNNHNGYIQLLVANGYLAYIIFMLLLYRNSTKISMEKFYIVSVILILNLFETQLIMTANIGGFLLMYLLGKEENNE